MKKREDERREWMGFETKDSVGWWHRGIRARMFKPTSSGRDGINGCGGCGCWDSVAVAVDMGCRRVCVDGKKVVGVVTRIYDSVICFGMSKIVCCANLGPIFNY